MKIVNLLDLAKSNNQIESDNALAKRLHVSQAALWKWRKGDFLPKIEHAHDLAILAGLDPAEVIADILVMSEKSPEVRKTLERLKSGLATAAAVALWLLPGGSSLQVGGISFASNIHYTQSRRRNRIALFLHIFE